IRSRWSGQPAAGLSVPRPRCSLLLLAPCAGERGRLPPVCGQAVFGRERHRGRLVMSCMTPATDNSWISIDDEEARAFRASVIEWLMINHPHDCPVCEEGEHC